MDIETVKKKLRERQLPTGYVGVLRRLEELTINYPVTSLEEVKPSDKAKTKDKKKIEKPSQEIKGTTLLGKTFVFTGTLRNMSRKTAEALIEQYSGTHTKLPSSHTSYVVVGANPGNNKMNKVKELHIPTLTQDEFINMVEPKAKPKAKPRANPISVKY
jgi:BRCT domain type II-containing protein